jgi:hypothetical protein
VIPKHPKIHLSSNFSSGRT